MRSLRTIVDLTPALVFAIVAAFLGARLFVGYAPSDPLAWQAYMALAPYAREIAVYVPATGILATIAAIAALLVAIAVCLFAMRNDSWQRTGFIAAHGALLTIILAMRDEQVWSASADSALTIGTYSLVPDFSAADPLLAVLLACVVVACAGIHRRMVWRMRHPLRKVS